MLTYLLITAVTMAESDGPLYKDATQPIPDRANDLIKRMTVNEKVYHISPTYTAFFLGLGR